MMPSGVNVLSSLLLALLFISVPLVAGEKECGSTMNLDDCVKHCQTTGTQSCPTGHCSTTSRGSSCICDMCPYNPTAYAGRHRKVERPLANKECWSEKGFAACVKQCKTSGKSDPSELSQNRDMGGQACKNAQCITTVEQGSLCLCNWCF